MCFYVQVFQKTGSGNFLLVSLEFVFILSLICNAVALLIIGINVPTN